MDRGAWQAIVCGVAELDMTEPLTLIHFRKKRTVNSVILHHTNYFNTERH